MEEYANGIETAVQLEEQLGQHGVTYQLRDGNGFMVIADDHVFIVREPNQGTVDEFEFKNNPAG